MSLDVALMRLGLDQTVSLANECAQELEVVRIGARKKVTERGPR